MKTRLFFPFMAALLLLSSAHANPTAPDIRTTPPGIQKGDDYAAVVAELGQPNGLAGSDQFLVLSFNRGEVIMRHGKVSSFNLISEQELANRQERQQAREASMAMERERRLAEGRALLSDRENDPAFIALPASARLAFWDAFRQKYPEIDVDLQYQVVRNEVRHERRQYHAQVERERQLRQLEARVRHAELRAESAEREARQAQRQPTIVRTHSYYPVYHNPPPCNKQTNQGTRVVVRSGSTGNPPAQTPPANTRQQFLRESLAHVR